MVLKVQATDVVEDRKEKGNLNQTLVLNVLGTSGPIGLTEKVVKSRKSQEPGHADAVMDQKDQIKSVVDRI